MYKWLSIQMGLPEGRTHIRFFNKEDCLKAISILKPKYIQLYGCDYEGVSAIIERRNEEHYMNNSPNVLHIICTEELKDQLRNSNTNLILDERPKIEDVNLLKQKLKDEFDLSIALKLNQFLDKYMEQYNK